MADDPINHPAHYTSSPSGIECIEIAQHMNFCLGNALKYIWRADKKGAPLEDLRKARWYLDRELARRMGGPARFEDDAEAELKRVLAWLVEEGNTAAAHGKAGDARLDEWASCLQYVHDRLLGGQHRGRR